MHWLYNTATHFMRDSEITTVHFSFLYYLIRWIISVINGCESCTTKKAERRRIDAFELWCWRRLLRVPWTARRSNQSILKEISPGCSLKGLMLKLKLQYSPHGHLIWKDPDAGKDWGQEEKGTTEDEMVGWHHQHNGHGFGWTPGVGDGQGGLAYCSSRGHKESEMTEQLNWTEWLLSSKSCSGQCIQNYKGLKKKGLGAGGEGDDRGWDGWMASLTWWTWVWVNSSSRWWTGRPGLLRFMGLQRVGHDWATELTN